MLFASYNRIMTTHNAPRMFRHREPLYVEQCHGCAEDVCVYSERQLLDGEVYCSKCRKIAREEDRKVARAANAEAEKKAIEKKAEIKASNLCYDGGAHVAATSPTGVRFCNRCLAAM